MLNNKFKKLLKKNSEKDKTILNQVYASNVNKDIGNKYRYGEENAILRKTLSQVIEKLQGIGLDTTIFNEFKEYNTYVESLKIETKKELEL